MASRADRAAAGALCAAADIAGSEVEVNTLAILSAKEVRRLLAYDPISGAFTWKVRVAQCIRIGDSAGGINGHGYQTIHLCGHRYQAHRLAFLIMTGRWPDGDIDHCDRNRANNAWKNLRECTEAENTQNRSVGRNSTSGSLGVTWYARIKKWQAQIQADGRNHYLGVFTSKLEAQAAYLTAKSVFHPFSVGAPAP